MTFFFAAMLLAAQGDLQTLFREYYEDYLRWHPETATSLGRREYDREWTDVSKPAREARLKALRGYLERLERFDAAGLSEQDRISRELLRQEITEDLEIEPLAPMLRFGQMFGFHNRVFSTVDQMPAQTAADYETILARIRAVPRYVEQHIALFEEGLGRGLTQPRVIAELTVAQLARQGALSDAEAPVLAPFRRFPGTVAPADRERLLREARVVYATEFLPAWHRLHRWARETYLTKARAETGISAIEKGQDWYAMRVRHSTTTSLSPKEIHEIGLREVERIEREMESIAHATGWTGSLNEFEKKLQADPQHLFRSKEEMLVYCRDVAKRAEPEMPKLFRTLPRMPFGIRAIPEDREAVTASHYLAPALDGSRAGFFMLNAYEPQKQVRYTVDALVLHEGVPGHHFQVALQRELEGLPEFRKIYSNTAYAEGWALYAESLGEEMGIYDTPYKRFGKLASERFRSVRLVVDTGLHAFAWSRDKAVEYFRLHAPDETLAEIDRYISMPAQALGYKIGEIRIRQLREETAKRLGVRFDLRAFHDVILRNGPLPLDLLEREVQALR